MFFERYPLTAANQLRNEMSDLFTDVFRWPFDGRRGARGYPALNVWEDSDNVFAEAEVPGLKMEDIEVYVVGDELTLRGRRNVMEGKEQTYHRQERGTGEFSRSITLPYQISADNVIATLKDGVLMLTLPKAEAAKPRKITVKT